MKSKHLKNSINYLDPPSKKWWVVICVFTGLFLLAGIAVTATGCAGKFPPIKTYDQAKKEVDAQGPLITPTIEKREGYKPGASQVLVKGAAAPSNGILIDRNRASYLAAIKAERDRRRTELEVVKRKAAIVALIYESTLANIRARAKEQNNWWHGNKGIIGLVTGATIMGALIIGLVYALTSGNGINSSSTNTMILQTPGR